MTSPGVTLNTIGLLLGNVSMFEMRKLRFRCIVKCYGSKRPNTDEWCDDIWLQIMN